MRRRLLIAAAGLIALFSLTPLAARPVSAAGNTGKGLYVVQFKGPIGDDARRALSQAGAEVSQYVPDFAFVVRVTNAQAQTLAANGLVQSVSKYRPESKISPAMVRQGKVRLRIQTVPGDEQVVTDAVHGLGGQVMRSRSGTLTVDAGADTIDTLSLHESVLAVEEELPIALSNDVVRSILHASGTGSPWAAGLTGTGQVVAVADTGLDTGNLSTLHPDLKNRLQTAPIALGRTGDWSDPNGHGTHVAGTLAGDGTASGGQYKGMAPGAKLVFQSLLTAGGGMVTPDIYTLLDQAASYGAKVHSDSWGTPLSAGGYTYNGASADVDAYTWQHKDFTVLFAAGNEGGTPGAPVYSSVTSPGTAKNAITVGASENLRPTLGPYSDNANEVAYFSSRGWAPDGRVKPDLVAPGTWVLSARSSLAPSGDFWSVLDSQYAYMGGTSMATPAVAGAAALVRQFYTDVKHISPAASLVKATLINGAQDIGPGWMSRDQGWGRVDLANSLYPTGGRVNWFENEAVSLTTGQSQTYSFSADSGQILKFTLVWTDYPGAIGSGKKLVNDLDLEVTAPGGLTYKGNCFQSNTAAATCAAADHVNNVENVYFAAPVAGTYTAKVKGYNVPQGVQPYALVVSGNSLQSGQTGPAVSLSGLSTVRVHGTVPVTAAVDSAAPVDRVEFYVDGALKSSVTSAPYTWNWDTTLATNAIHTVQAKAYDTFGNPGAASATVTVDNAGPVLALTAPAGGAILRGVVNLTATATDSAGVAKVEFSVDGSLMSTDTTSPYTWAWTTTGSANGPHTLTARAYDNEGNVTAATAAVAVDNQAPTVSLTAPASGSLLRQSATLSATAADNDRVTKVDFYADSKLLGTATTAPYTLTCDTTQIASGAHALTAKAYDAVGNLTVSAGVPVVVDNLAPKTTVSMTPKQAMVKGSVTVSATASDNQSVASVELYLDGAVVKTFSAAPYSYLWDTTQSALGSHTLSSKAYDALGNSAQSPALTVTVDNTPPAVSLSVPAAGATVIGTVNVTANATDNQAVTKVEFYLDGVVKATRSASPFVWAWSTTTATNGAHTLLAKAYDAAGNVTASAPIAVTADLPPQVSGLKLSSGANASGTVAATVTATDAVGVTKVEYYVDGVLTGSVTSAPYTWIWDTTGTANGAHSVQAKAYDAAGNVTASAPVAVKVDNAAPVVALTAPSSGQSVPLNATVTATATDNAGVAKVEFYVDDALKFTDSTAPYSWAWNTSSVSAGSHRVAVKAYDAAGNTATSAVSTVTVDNLLPVVSITSPDTTAHRGSVTVSATATDNAGVAKVEYYLDGQLKGSLTTGPFTWTWDTTTATNGNHTISIKAYDTAGNVAVTTRATPVDNQAPAVSLSAALNGATVKGIVNLTTAATDNKGVVKVEWYLDGGLMGAKTTGPWSYAWDTTKTANGSHSLQAKAYDAVGNVTTSTQTVVTVAN